MFDAAIKALQQMFSPPFRSVLIKSVLLALVMIVLIGVGLHKGLTFLTQSGSSWAEGNFGPGTHGPLAVMVWIVSVATSLGIIVGGIFLMPAVTAFVGSFFVDEIAERVEQAHYASDPSGKA